MIEGLPDELTVYCDRADVFAYEGDKDGQPVSGVLLALGENWIDLTPFAARALADSLVSNADEAESLLRVRCETPMLANGISLD